MTRLFLMIEWTSFYCEAKDDSKLQLNAITWEFTACTHSLTKDQLLTKYQFHVYFLVKIHIPSGLILFWGNVGYKAHNYTVVLWPCQQNSCSLVSEQYIRTVDLLRDEWYYHRHIITIICLWLYAYDYMPMIICLWVLSTEWYSLSKNPSIWQIAGSCWSYPTTLQA